MLLMAQINVSSALADENFRPQTILAFATINYVAQRPPGIPSGLWIHNAMHVGSKDTLPLDCYVRYWQSGTGNGIQVPAGH
jgi:hypothetical protein